MKISDIEKSYYNSIGISKRAIKLKARKPPYERKIREKSKVSIEDYNDLL